MKKFCFFLSLRVVAYIIGAVDCILRLIGIGLAVYVIFFSEIEKNTFIYCLYGCELVLMLIIVISCILLIVGVYKKIAVLLLPWIIANSLYILPLVIDAIYFFVKRRSSLEAFLCYLVISVLYTYLIVSMCSLHYLLKQEDPIE